MCIKDDQNIQYTTLVDDGRLIDRSILLIYDDDDVFFLHLCFLSSLRLVYKKIR